MYVTRVALLCLINLLLGCSSQSADKPSAAPAPGESAKNEELTAKDAESEKGTVDESEVEQASASFVRAHVSMDGERAALIRQRDDHFHVSIDDVDYGPFIDTDAATISPFRVSNDYWFFRAKRPDGLVLINADGIHGPFEEIWPPTANGSQWGAIVIHANKYHVIVNGVLSEPFDEIAGDHRTAEFALQEPVDLDVPLFYGENHWVAFCRTGTELFLVTDQETHGPYGAIGRQQFNTAAGELAPAELPRNISFDGSTLAVGVSRSDANGTTEHFLWIDGVEQGPFAELPEFHAIEHMSMDGKHWAFRGEHVIHSSRGSFAKRFPTLPALSDNGQTLAYAFGEDNDYHIVVNDQQFGPYDKTSAPAVSPDGSRWIAAISPVDEDEEYVLTENGEMGPYAKLGRTLFEGKQSLTQITHADGTFSPLIDGETFGPYAEFLVSGLPADRTNDKSWHAHGLTSDGTIDIFDTGARVASVGPFKSISLLRTKAPHWSALVRRGDDLILIEDGELSDVLGPFTQVISHSRSTNQAKIAIIGRDAMGKFSVVLHSIALGPYETRPTRLALSSDGQHWAFTLPDSTGKSQVIHDQGESPKYDEIADWSMTEKGPAFVARTGDQWWLHIGADTHGPFDAAGIAGTASMLFGVTVTGDEVQVAAY